MGVKICPVKPRAILCFCCTVTLGCGAILFLQVFCYVTGVYFGLNRVQEQKCVEKFLGVHRRDNSSGFPRHIHQIYFSIDGKEMSDTWSKAQSTWLQRNPKFKYSLWDTPKFQELLQTHYQDLVPLYESYDHWIMQIDLARLLILYHSGGVYVDLDVKSKTTLAPLYDKLSNVDTVLYYTEPFGTGSDFIMSQPGSRFMADVLCGLDYAQRRYVLPYVTSLMSAGPLYIYLRYLTYQRRNDVNVLRHANITQYISHIDGRSWHQWDGDVLWWLYIRRNIVLTVGFVIVCIFVLSKLRHRAFMRRFMVWTQRQFRTKVPQPVFASGSFALNSRLDLKTT